MTVGDFMTRNRDFGGRFYLGADNGFGFVFIGTSGEFFRKSPYINEECLGRLDSLIRENSRFLAQCEERLSSVRRDPEASDRTVRSLDRRTERLTRFISETQKARDSFRPICERKVSEVFRRISGGYAVIYEGTEHGSYWTYGEYRNAVPFTPVTKA